MLKQLLLRLPLVFLVQIVEQSPQSLAIDRRQPSGTHEVREQRLPSVLPLVFDLASPSPAIGWANAERMTLAERGPVDLLLALAVTHHLAVSNNVPFAEIAHYFSCLCRQAIVEFVPKTDPMVQRMLQGREDIFGEYTQAAFELAFGARFEIDERVLLSPSNRILYRMTTR